MVKYVEFHGLLQEYMKVFDDLIAFENEKLQVVLGNHPDQLDKLMKDEQVYLLKLRGLDVKREKLQTENGVQGLSFSEIISKSEGREHDELEIAFKELSRRTSELKSITDSSKRYIEVHIHSLDNIISELGGESTIQAAYNKKGEQKLTGVTKFDPKRV